jgi:seryl-tRNA synthetase
MKFCCVWTLWTWTEVDYTFSLQPYALPYYSIGAKIAGHRGYYLTNDGVDLNQALISYGLDYLRSKQFKKIQPPFFMNKDQMAKTAQLDQFDEELYKVNICSVSCTWLIDGLIGT